MGNNNEAAQAEISLKEIIETLLKGKILIAIFVVVSVILSAILSFFILPDVYDATAVIQANPIQFDANPSTTNELGIIENLTNLPNMTIAVYIQQIKSQNVLNATIEKLNLKDGQGNRLTAQSLMSSVEVENLANTNLLQITVHNRDPKQAAAIANSISECFIEYVTAITRKQGQQAVDLIAAQMAIEEDNLSDKALAMADFLKGENGNVDLLRNEVTNLTTQIADDEMKLRDTETQISADTQALKDLLAAADFDVNISVKGLSISITPSEGGTGGGTAASHATGATVATDAPAVENLNDNQNPATTGSQTGIMFSIATDQLSEALLRVDINKVHTRLIEGVAQKAALENKISEMSVALTEKQASLAEQEYKYDGLQRDLEITQNAYDAYQQKYKEAKLAAAADLGKSSIVVTAAAIAPEHPTSPDKMRNLLLAVVLGLFLGICVVLFINYWKRVK
jgi:polysaccharide biosynthesis transport protein